MKKISLLLFLFVCGVYAQDVKFTAKIANRNSDKLTISGEKKFRKEITVDKDGVFSATFTAPAGLYEMTDGTEFTSLYLKPGYDLTLTMDAKQFDESIVYKGKGEMENNFLAKKTLMEEEMQNTMQSVKSQEEFNKLVAGHHAKVAENLKAKGLDPEFKAAMEKAMKEETDAIAAQAAEAAEQEKIKQKLTGNVSPSFDFENFKGGKTKLEDLRGKYVYIDVWATWCGPCRQEIPHLQKVEEKYHGKNIAFVSLSVDEKKDYEKWKKMITDKTLGGIQLIADNNWNSDFVRAYNINSIPRFILLDPQGKVIDADAARPSDPALQAQLDGLLK
ncbi:TlpA family protein disulfide reductase [Flavobacterium pallidum]|uniref:TlpA family protein disulfide reductase n=1 Tax=Flavobacterium pallidum TaxID=2172098 RepID=A0A2S1SEP0_9FLAO|nr:TlpA disulfide reductase family protein [Flavobacterium pallidum]AWI24834.1 TlpA family protein disulfide reductase [Flavobacterium pallidum]